MERDPVIEEYKKHVDRTLLRENLKLTVEQRLRNLMELQKLSEELRAGRSEGAMSVDYARFFAALCGGNASSSRRGTRPTSWFCAFDARRRHRYRRHKAPRRARVIDAHRAFRPPAAAPRTAFAAPSGCEGAARR